MTSRRFEKLFDGPARKPETEITRREMDLARSIQAVTEDVVLAMARHAAAETGQRDACLAGALDRAEPWGVWGGEIFERGAVIARKRPRGRPRKVVAA